MCVQMAIWKRQNFMGEEGVNCHAWIQEALLKIGDT
jgi:hypothetical protein